MGVVSTKNRQAAELDGDEAGYHRSWFPVCLASELQESAVIGRPFLGTKVVAWRDAAGKPVVQQAWCPHIGADLSLGQIVEANLRCPYHHWSFDRGGACVRIPAGDKIPPAARLFTYPVEEAWGIIWAFNGETADFAPPRLPGAVEAEITYRAHVRGHRNFDNWVAVSNGVDFQHLQTLHGMPRTMMPECLEVDPGGIEFRVETPFYLQHGRITGTNTFAQHLRIGGNDMFQLFTGVPLGPNSSMGFYVVGVPRGHEARLDDVRAMVDRLNAEDQPVLETIRFRRGLLTASDRHLARYFKYVEEFPSFRPT